MRLHRVESSGLWEHGLAERVGHGLLRWLLLTVGVAHTHLTHAHCAAKAKSLFVSTTCAPSASRQATHPANPAPIPPPCCFCSSSILLKKSDIVLLTCLCAVGAGAELFDVELDDSGAVDVGSDGFEALELEGAVAEDAEAVRGGFFISLARSIARKASPLLTSLGRRRHICGRHILSILNPILLKVRVMQIFLERPDEGNRGLA